MSLLQSPQGGGKTDEPLISEPNQFELQGEGVSIVYSSSSIAGVPQFSYHDADWAVSRSGDEIRTEVTEFGTLATIDVANVPDALHLTATLLLPSINLREQNAETPFATITVMTTSARSSEGQMQTYRALNLTGVARFVVF